jgi:glycerol transport system permease protein
MMRKSKDKIAYLLLSPALLVMLISGVIPMSMILYYSVHDSFYGNNFIWVGMSWFQQVLSSAEFYGAFFRSIGFSALIISIEIPLGIYIALRLPQKGFLSNLYIVLISLPLLIPSIVVGHIWKFLTLPEIGLISTSLEYLGVNYDMNDPIIVWITLALMDSWHWTSLVVLLCFAGLKNIPDAYYQAAIVDGASGWSVFKNIQLPKLKLVLLIAVLLRFIDSFIIYTEAYVLTRGGPGVSTTFLSHELVQTATIQFDLGEGGAMSVIYSLVVLCVSWVFFSLIVRKNNEQ